MARIVTILDLVIEYIDICRYRLYYCASPTSTLSTIFARTPVATAVSEY